MSVARVETGIFPTVKLTIRDELLVITEWIVLLPAKRKTATQMLFLNDVAVLIIHRAK